MIFLTALFTDPLFTALIAKLHAPGVGALGGRQAQVVGAEGDAADGPVHADALQRAGGLEALPVVVDLAQQVTSRALMSWGKEEEEEMLSIFNIWLPGLRVIPNIGLGRLAPAAPDLPTFSRKISSPLWRSC